MPHMSLYARNRVRVLQQNLSRTVDIQRALKEEGIKVSRQSLSALIRKIKTYGIVSDLPRSGRKPLLALYHLDFIDRCLQHNNETSARDLQQKFARIYRLHISLSALKYARKKLGWRYTGTKYCQLVRDENKLLRQVFCLECIATNENFSDVIFSDECSVKMGRSLRKSFRKINEPRQLVGKPKHPTTVHVWAGISVRGATKICVFNGIMDTTFYIDILRTHLLPFIQDVFPDHHRFQQDNDPKHTARATKIWFEENDVNLWPTPPESPDMNPIENMWAALKHYIYKVTKPSTQEELVNGIGDFWATVTPAMCQRYIHHIHRVMPVVIMREGQASGY